MREGDFYIDYQFYTPLLSWEKGFGDEVILHIVK
jgi:hypothetical protein